MRSALLAYFTVATPKSFQRTAYKAYFINTSEQSFKLKEIQKKDKKTNEKELNVLLLQIIMTESF